MFVLTRETTTRNKKNVHEFLCRKT